MEETTLTRGDAIAPAPVPEPAPLARHADPATLVIFGGLGDLAGRKLFPSLMNLQRHGLVPTTSRSSA